MKAHKELEWESSDSDGGAVYAACGYFIYRYGNGIGSTWRLEGNGLDVMRDDINALKKRAQEHYNRKRQLKAWEDYMLTHEPPEETTWVMS